MKKNVRQVLAFAIVLGASLTCRAADAADLGGGRYYTAPAPLSAYSWTGPYLGLNIGYQWGYTTNNATRPWGLDGGLQGGYNWQFGQFVVGAEGDLQISGASDTFAPWKFSNPWFGTLRGRGGVALNNVLLYATAGLALGGLRGENAGLSESKTSLGWAAGAGVEVGFTPNWSAKVEYLYVGLAERGFSASGTSNGLRSNIFRLGVDYHL
jgi:outer membrane immunogenic protein